MARNQSSFAKRQREQERQRKRENKIKQRKERRVQKGATPPRDEDGVDPDLAHIVPGPQPKPWDDDPPGPENDAPDRDDEPDV